MEKLKSSITNMALVLTGVAVITGAILAAVNQVTKEPIALQKEKALADGIKAVMECDELVVTKTDVVKQNDAKGKELSYTIYQTQGTLENLNIYLVGDLKYGRTVHSLIMAMRHFNPTFHFIAPKELAMPNEYKIYCKEHGIKFQEHTAFNEKVIADADIIYMTRVQKERFSDLMEYERVKNVYILRADMLGNTKPNMRILHPLPRVNEIAYDVDDNPHAYYIQQAQNGLYAREDIICDVLGITLDEVKNDKTIIG